MVAPEPLTEEALTAEMSGGALVVNVKSAELAWSPCASLESTWKWYVVEGNNPVKVSPCKVVRVETKGDIDPYAALVPYATWELAATLVFQLMVSLESVAEVAVTAEMIGGALVVKVKSPEVAWSPWALLEST